MEIDVMVVEVRSDCAEGALNTLRRAGNLLNVSIEEKRDSCWKRIVVRKAGDTMLALAQSLKVQFGEGNVRLIS